MKCVYFRKIYRPVAILIERAANGHALISDLIRKFPHLVRPIEPDGRSKSARLLAHADTILSKRVYLPALAPWRDAFVQEFCSFPKGKFTDQVDATTQLLDHAGEFAGTGIGSGERAIAATATGRRSISSREASAELLASRDMAGQLDRRSRPIISIKTEVNY